MRPVKSMPPGSRYWCSESTSPARLTIWHNGSESTFVPGHDVIVGRDLRADVRIADPRISRAHLILRFEQGKWVAIDNGSVNGTFVNGYRRPVIDVHDGQSINIGNAGGPQLTFEIGARRGKGAPAPAAGPRRLRSRRCPGRRRPVPRRSRPCSRPRRRSPGGPPHRRPPSRRVAPLRTSGRATAAVTLGVSDQRAGRPPAGPPPEEVTRSTHARRRCDTCRPPKSPCWMRALPRARILPPASSNESRRGRRRPSSRPALSRSAARRTTTSWSPTCWPPGPRHADPDPAGHRDPRHQRQRHIRQRHPGGLGDSQRR